MVYLRGIFKFGRFYTAASAENTLEFKMKNLQSLEKKIKSIPGVVDIVFELINWKKVKGQWVPKDLKADS